MRTHATTTGQNDAPDWDIARFRSCILRRGIRELVCAGAVQLLEPRAFDILLLLLERRNEVVSKGEIMDACWGTELPTDSALARAVMKVRRAILDSDPESPIIKTVHGIGYQFVCPVDFGEGAPLNAQPLRPNESAGPTTRLVLLPVANLTTDNSRGWVELGLMSLVAKALQALPDVSIVPVQDVFAALRGVGTSDTPERRLEVIESSLGAVNCVWGELSGSGARLVLHFNLKMSTGLFHRGTVMGSDPAKMAMDAVLHICQWLTPKTKDVPAGQDIDLGDRFLNQVFARALQCGREERLEESEHLLEILLESGVKHVAVLQEVANVALALARPGAEEHIRTLEVAARESGSAWLQAACLALQGRRLELTGKMAESVAATLEAVNIARIHGLVDLTARLMVTCASRMAMGLDDRADVLLSQAILRAERLSNRVVLCDAYCAAGRVAGFRNDWNSALHHQLAAVEIANTMHEASRSWAYGALSWVQSELGHLDDAARSAAIAFRTARLSGAEPQGGLAAGQAALAYLSCRRIRDTVNLYVALRQPAADSSLATLVARDAYCCATLLCVSGHFDEALAMLDSASEMARHHPRLLGRCHALRLRVLLQAKYFDELEATCTLIHAHPYTPQDVRLYPLIERALAFRDHLTLGRTSEAIERLNRAIRSQAASEVHAVISMDTAWLHLERGEVDEAIALTAPLQTWLEQSQPGLMIAGRILDLKGDRAGAHATVLRSMRRFSESSTQYERSALSLYEQSTRRLATDAFSAVDEPITLHWRIATEVLDGMPSDLGGRAAAVKPVRNWTAVNPRPVARPGTEVAGDLTPLV